MAIIPNISCFFRLHLVFCAVSASAAVSFAPVKNYPNIGFMFPCLANAKATPVPMPHAHAYLLSDGDTLTREDRFDPFELWYQSQCCARWRDPAGNRFVIGRVTHGVPVFPVEHVSRTQFRIGLDDEEIDPKNQTHINAWVAAFSAIPVSEPEPLRINGVALDSVLYYPCTLSDTLVYAFQPRRVGNAKNSDWFCVILYSPGEANVEELRAQFEEKFIGQIALPSRSSKGEGSTSEEVTLLRQNKELPDQPDHPIRIEARKSIENYADWWFAETTGYIILSDVDTEIGTAMIRNLQDTLPALQQAYARLLPPLTRETDIALIRLFQTRDAYVRHVGEANAWSGGMWMPGRRELVLFLHDSHPVMMRMLRHELFHQYLSHAYCMLPTAPWLNEGHACFFENAQVDAKGKVALEEDPDRISVLLENLDEAVKFLPQLLRATHTEFYSGTSASLRLKYALAWGLAYYLQKGAPQERNTPFKDVLPDYAAALALTHDGEAATIAAFKNVDLTVFQENFREFWLKRRGSAMRYNPLEP